MRLPVLRFARLAASFLLVTLGMVATSVAQAPAPGSPLPPPAPSKQAKPAPKPVTAAAKRAAAMEAGPMVLSAEAAAALRKKHARDDRYGGPSDDRDVPAWRQASFFGLRAEGKVFIFVVDRSGSMEEGDRLDRAKRELIRSIGAMQPPQRFQVIFYNDRATTLGDLPKSADYSARNQLARWLNRIDAEGGTDPREALALALGQRPDAVFLLSDGAFPDGTPPAVAALNPHKIPIHCVDLAGGASGDDLKIIARDSGGQYAGGGR